MFKELLTTHDGRRTPSDPKAPLEHVVLRWAKKWQSWQTNFNPPLSCSKVLSYLSLAQVIKPFQHNGQNHRLWHMTLIKIRLHKICSLICMIHLFNPLPNDRFLDMTKLKTFADDKLNVATMILSLCDKLDKRTMMVLYRPQRLTMKIDTKYQSSWSNDYERDNTHKVS